jgi:hypothetical protein
LSVLPTVVVAAALNLSPMQKKKSKQVAAAANTILLKEAGHRQSSNLSLRSLQSMPECDRFACVSNSPNH